LEQADNTSVIVVRVIRSANFFMVKVDAINKELFWGFSFFSFSKTIGKVEYLDLMSFSYGVEESLYLKLFVTLSG